MSKVEENRRRTRENMAKDLHRHNEKLGRQSSYEQCYRHVCERADRLDAKRDRNIKE